MNEETKTEGVVTTDTPTDNNPQPQADKTFSQDEVNRIVSERLKEDRQKREPKPDPLATREAELDKREFALEARSLLKDKGHSERLLEVLNAPDIESLEKCLAVIEEIYGGSSTPMPRVVAPCKGSGAGGAGPIRDAMGLHKR